MLVYRIEGENGDGIYRGKYCRDNPLEWIPSKHPAPWRDSLLVNNCNAIRGVEDDEDCSCSMDEWLPRQNYIFGFANTDQLRAWVFNDLWLWQFEQRGFRLSVFDIESRHVIVGNTQCIFKREHIKQASYFKPAEFFGIEEEPEDLITVSYNDDE